MSTILSPPQSFVRHLRGHAGLCLGASAIVLWFLAVQSADYSRMSGYGLVSVLGWPYFVALTFVILGFGLELFRPQLRPRSLLFLVMVFVLILYGTAPAVEPVAALTDSWIHAGFIQYILTHGQPLNGYDARFSWPGAFSMVAILTKFAGQSNAIGFLRWFPLFIEMAYLAPLLVIAKFSGVGHRAAWLGIAIYFSANWIYQDYFSPQALNFFFFLVIIAACLACWQPMKMILVPERRGSLRNRLRRTLRFFTRDRIAGRHATSTWGARQNVGLLAFMLILFLAAAMSHQLTPPAMIIALVALLATRRLGRPEFIILIVLFTFGWLSLGASNYWVGHLNNIFGSLGQFSSKLSSNVTSRVTGQPTHLIVVKLRILLTAVIFLLAGVGTLRRHTDSRTLELLVAGPFLLFAAQSYGGEGLIRVVLYGLPFSALLAASAFVPREDGEIRAFLRLPPGWITRLINLVIPTLVTVTVLAFALVTTVVRGGNDAYESFSSGELAAVDYVYNHVHAGQVIGLTNYYMPIGQRDVGLVNEYIAPDGSPGHVTKLSSHLLAAKPEFVILSKSQEAYGEEVVGYRAGWEKFVQRTLVANGYSVVAHWATATVLQK